MTTTHNDAVKLSNQHQTSNEGGFGLRRITSKK
jgi:hypothetical protein